VGSTPSRARATASPISAVTKTFRLPRGVESRVCARTTVRDSALHFSSKRILDENFFNICAFFVYRTAYSGKRPSAK